MPPKRNPLKLNTLQLKTLTIIQQLAKSPETSSRDETSGEIQINNLPQPHGNHFHCGDAVVMSRDASGIRNESVWKALERKGLLRSTFPSSLTLLPEGLAYQTHLSGKIIHRSDH
ncbi:MAG: hypothetical protein VYB39_02430 [Pseudomonadota bacterium]|nr:hypothetical protein [Pseudomonadota bacterium]